MSEGLVLGRSGSSVSVMAGDRTYTGLGLGPDGFRTSAPAGFVGRVLLEVRYRFIDGVTTTEFIAAGENGTVVPVVDPDGADITLDADHVDLLDWLHGSLMVGNMVMDGAQMGGDLAAFSTLEGIVSSPRVDPSPADAAVVRWLRDRAAAADS